jgi:hypothetical protein
MCRYLPCSLHTLRERNTPRGSLKAAAAKATTDSLLPDSSTVPNRDRTQCRFEIRDSQPHAHYPQGMLLRCSTGAALYHLANRENTAASVTHRFGPHDHVSCDDRGA